MTEIVFQFICVYIQTHTASPSLQEIATGCYIGITTVVYHLDKLEKRGRISRDPGKHRNIRLLHKCMPANAAVS